MIMKVASQRDIQIPAEEEVKKVEKPLNTYKAASRLSAGPPRMSSFKSKPSSKAPKEEPLPDSLSICSSRPES
jgi:hypothetical protein